MKGEVTPSMPFFLGASIGYLAVNKCTTGKWPILACPHGGFVTCPPGQGSVGTVAQCPL